jgi:TonB family protein
MNKRAAIVGLVAMAASAALLVLFGCGGSKVEVAAPAEPKPVSTVQPAYPEACRKAGVEGKVLVMVVVGEKGDIMSAQVSEGSGNAELDSAALAAVQQWRFEPGTKEGKPVEAKVIVPVQFRLGDKAKPTGSTRQTTPTMAFLDPPQV